MTNADNMVYFKHQYKPIENGGITMENTCQFYAGIECPLNGKKRGFLDCVECFNGKHKNILNIIEKEKQYAKKQCNIAKQLWDIL